MEARKITVVSTRNQKKSVIMSAATTLAELKADLRQNGIDYDGMTFYEGTSKVELKDGASVLPHDVPYKGQTTNELVFMLTNTNKKIRSGAGGTMKRKEVYDKITELGLQDECKRKFGRNFTQCTTADLISLVEKAGKKAAPASAPKAEKPVPTPVKEEKKEEVPVSADTPTPETPAEFVDTKARAALSRLLTILTDNGTLEDDGAEEIEDVLGGKIEVAASEDYKPSSASPYSDDEIDRMFDFAR